MDSTQIDKHLNNWLRDAHAMEEQAEQMLSAQSSRIENYPELSRRLEQHMRETQTQRERLETCMQARGITSSAVKDMGAKFTAMMQAVGGSMTGDEVVKGSQAGYTFEHFEISSYRALIAAAEVAGDTRTAQVAQQNLQEELEMAGWLENHLPEVTRTFLQRAAGDMSEAKR